MNRDPAPPAAGEVVPLRPVHAAGRGGDEAGDDAAWSTAFGAQRLLPADADPEDPGP